MGTITINGKIYTGNTIVIRNGQVIVDGDPATPNDKIINILVKGDIDSLVADACNQISIEGKILDIKTQSGDVKVNGNVEGDIRTMSGDVECSFVKGSVSTMSGDIIQRK